jgi:hypothetical protein
VIPSLPVRFPFPLGKGLGLRFLDLIYNAWQVLGQVRKPNQYPIVLNQNVVLRSDNEVA